MNKFSKEKAAQSMLNLEIGPSTFIYLQLDTIFSKVNQAYIFFHKDKCSMLNVTNTVHIYTKNSNSLTYYLRKAAYSLLRLASSSSSSSGNAPGMPLSGLLIRLYRLFLARSRASKGTSVITILNFDCHYGKKCFNVLVASALPSTENINTCRKNNENT